jgi:type II secretory pathway component PulF
VAIGELSESVNVELPKVTQLIITLGSSLLFVTTISILLGGSISYVGYRLREESVIHTGIFMFIALALTIGILGVALYLPLFTIADQL